MNIPVPDARQPLLTARRNQKMARSPHAYVRGNTAQYYEWLHSLRGHNLPHGPAIWICGDCHLGNLGPLAAADGRVEVQIRDFDQTIIGNPAHDLVRLGLSLAAVARGSRLPGAITAGMLEHLVAGYEQALEAGHDGQSRVRMQKPEVVKVVLRSAVKRSWKELARERIVDTRPNIPLGKNFWPLSKAEKKSIATMFESKEVISLITRLKSRDEDAKIEVADAAYWVKGCSSLGRLRYAVLVNVGDDDYCLIDIKEATIAAAPRYAHVSMPRDNARRVVEGARHMSPALGERMAAQRFLAHGVFIRELLPQDLKLEIEELGVEQATHMARYLGHAVGCAHARQMDDPSRKSWLRELKLNRPKTLATPAWLWNSVVQLIASHEGGYLEHCRKYALSGDNT
ncbi:DUF2252 domain-containing protein [Glaciimonas immobilis]|uniref:Uncharacterized protein (DUF2252 family) n=1 Tax=Glaciimonas immobilis TaxID=728004 RepID=A0A840RZS2_9BURK|nr:DUF2252 domain-containing protein [Glaciimonas immobilis]KAF3996313.1 DUF2252 domain-containing protein [Glaciimonas immobilis]MBB5202144.1 uncharacterized protein (DUF2252 family) [Glaciimonas immobilis]